MTRQEFEARKRKIVTIAAIGIFCLISSQTIGYVMPGNAQLMILLTAIFLGCIFVAGRMWFKLSKEIAAK